MLIVRVHETNSRNGEAIEIELNKSEFTIGRGDNNDLVLRDYEVSKCHAKVSWTSAGCQYSDLGSTNGSWVNDQRVSSVILKEGQNIRIGHHLLQFAFREKKIQMMTSSKDSNSDQRVSAKQIPFQFALSSSTAVEICLLGESNARRAIFLNLLLGIPLFPEQEKTGKLPLCKIHSGRKSGLWLNEDNTRVRPLSDWGDIPNNWHSFLYTELTLAEHPLFKNGLVIWNIPDIDLLSAEEQQRVEEFLDRHPNTYRLIQYFSGAEIGDPGGSFLKRWKTRLRDLVVVCSLPEQLNPVQRMEVEKKLKKYVLTSLGPIPVFPFSVGNAYLEFMVQAMAQVGTSNPWELARKWKDIYVPLEQIFQGHTDVVVGEELFEHIINLAQEEITPQVESTTVDPHQLLRTAEDARPEAQLELGKKLLQEGQKNTAIALLTGAAQAGLSEAQSLLGLCYWDGIGVTTNYSAAAEWFQKASIQNDPLGIAGRGWCLLRGRGLEKNVDEAFQCFLIAAEKGIPRGQAGLGACHFHGLGARRNYVEATKWLLKAASGQDALGLYYLGLCYLNGWGTNRNYSDAVKLFQRAAEKECLAAKAALGFCHVRGFGLPKNAHEGLPMIMDAAEKGDAEGAFYLGECYLEGYGLKLDRSEAMKWYIRSAELGCARGKAMLAICIIRGQGVEKNFQEADRLIKEAIRDENEPDAMAALGFYYMSMTENPQNAANAIQPIRDAIEAGSTDAIYFLGICYLGGIGVNQDSAEAVRLFHRAAEADCHVAATKLALMYRDGVGVKKDEKEAIRWLFFAAEGEDKEAQALLGHMYHEGICGLQQDYSEAVKWHRIAAEKEVALGQRNLGLCYLDGHGVPKNDSEAVKWLQKAAEKNDADAQLFLGIHLVEGVGASQNTQEGYRWLMKAAEQNESMAMMQLGHYACQAEDYSSAFRWFTEATKLNYPEAFNWLGMMYEQGCGVQQDLKVALEYYQIASKLGDEEGAKEYQRLKEEMAQAPSSNCFVATATFGTPHAEEVLTLRRFRDECLIRSTPGRALVAFYDLAGPPAARWILRHPASRCILAPLLSRLANLISKLRMSS